MAEVIHALITNGQWITTSRVQLAQALAGWLEDLVELELYGSRAAPRATLRLRPGTTLADHTTAKPGAYSTGQG